MSKTEKNLRDIFAGESQANRKYLAFAKKAEQEGLEKTGSFSGMTSSTIFILLKANSDLNEAGPKSILYF